MVNGETKSSVWFVDLDRKRLDVFSTCLMRRREFLCGRDAQKGMGHWRCRLGDCVKRVPCGRRSSVLLEGAPRLSRVEVWEPGRIAVGATLILGNMAKERVTRMKSVFPARSVVPSVAQCMRKESDAHSELGRYAVEGGRHHIKAVKRWRRKWKWIRWAAPAFPGCLEMT